MQLTHDIVYYFGMAITIIGAVLLWFFTYMIKKNKSSLSIKENVKKAGIYGLYGTLALVLGFVLFDVAFYIDPGKIKYLVDQGIGFNGGRQFLSFFFIILNALGIGAFTIGLYLYGTYRNESPLMKKITRIIWAVACPVFIISTILWMEGNAPYFYYPLANTIHFGKEGIILINNHHTMLNGELVKIDGGFNIALYAVAILSGACTVLIITDFISFKTYGRHGLLTTCFLIAVPCGIIGARLWYVVLDLTKEGAGSAFYQDPMKIFRMWEGGLGIMGGATLGIIGGVTTMVVLTYVMKRPNYKGIKLLHMVDYIVPCILVAQCIGRWGNFFNNEVFGYAVDRQVFCRLPTWITNNMKFHAPGIVADTLGPNQIYLPLFFIEGCTNLLGYFVIYYGFCREFVSKGIIKLINLCGPKDNKIIKSETYHAPGSCAGMYLMWYGLTRIILEPLRNSTDKFNASIWTGYGLLIGGAAIVLFFILFHEIYTKRIRVKQLAAKGAAVEENTEAIEEISRDEEE